MTRTKLHLNPLETRDTPALFIVQSTADTGPSTLRAALNLAALAPGADEVSIDAFGTIQLDTPLPDLGSDVTISGPGAENLTIRPRNSNFNIFRVYRGVNVQLDGLTIQDGNAVSGGGVFNEGNLHVSNCAFDHNTAQDSGGGLYNLNGTVQVFHTSFTTNVASGAVGRGYGGGLAASDGWLDLFQCTFDRNFAAIDGGGVMLFGGNADVKIDRCTIVNNYCYYPSPTGLDGTGGGVVNGSGNHLLLHDTIVADNYSGTGGLRSDITTGSPVNPFSSYNLISTGTHLQGIADGVFGNRIGSDASPLAAGLGPVSAGKPYYHPLTLGSFAIDTGDPADLPGVSPVIDQRGRNRVVNNRIDIGAVEFQPAGVILTPQLLPKPGSPRDVTLVATVGPVAPGSNPLTGEVRFYLNDYDNVLGIQPLVGGRAQLDVPALPSGTIGIQYEGDTDYSSAQIEFPYTGGPVIPPPSGTPGTPGAQGAPLAGPVLVGAGSGGQVALASPGVAPVPFEGLPGVAGGVRVATGDFNRDGTPEYVVGSGPGSATRVRVLDGKTKAELFALDPFEASFTGGVFVAAGDLNGDGYADLVVTPDEGGGPRARVFSGQGFTQMADFFGIDDPNFRGGARAAVADVTGDGRGDLLVAAGFGGGPRLAGFEGASVAAGTPTKPFADFFVFEPSLRNGVYVAGGDLTGDGYAEVVVGGGPGGAPRVFALSGKDLLANQQTQAANFFAGEVADRGGVRVVVKDVDSDGRADVVAGAGGRVTAYSGQAIPTNGVPAEVLAADLFPGITGGVFVG